MSSLGLRTFLAGRVPGRAAYPFVLVERMLDRKRHMGIRVDSAPARAVEVTQKGSPFSGSVVVVKEGYLFGISPKPLLPSRMVGAIRDRAFFRINVIRALRFAADHLPPLPKGKNLVLVVDQHKGPVSSCVLQPPYSAAVLLRGDFMEQEVFVQNAELLHEIWHAYMLMVHPYEEAQEAREARIAYYNCPEDMAARVKGVMHLENDLRLYRSMVQHGELSFVKYALNLQKKAERHLESKLEGGLGKELDEFRAIYVRDIDGILEITLPFILEGQPVPRDVSRMVFDMTELRGSFIPGFRQKVITCRKFLLDALRFKNYLTAAELMRYVELTSL